MEIFISWFMLMLVLAGPYSRTDKIDGHWPNQMSALPLADLVGCRGVTTAGMSFPCRVVANEKSSSQRQCLPRRGLSRDIRHVSPLNSEHGGASIDLVDRAGSEEVLGNRDNGGPRPPLAASDVGAIDYVDASKG